MQPDTTKPALPEPVPAVSDPAAEFHLALREVSREQD